MKNYGQISKNSQGSRGVSDSLTSYSDRILNASNILDQKRRINFFKHLKSAYNLAMLVDKIREFSWEFAFIPGAPPRQNRLYPLYILYYCQYPDRTQNIRKSCCFSEIFYIANFQIILHLMQRLEKLRYTLVPFAWSQNFIPTLEIYSNTHLVELLNRIIHHNLLNFQFRDSTRNSFYQITIKCFDNLKDIWYGGTINIFQI